MVQYMSEAFDVSKIEGFEWDVHNSQKNQLKHRVSPEECQELFYNKPLLVSADKTHSTTEKRLQALGKTDGSRELFLVFTIRKNSIRVISARDQSRKERIIYQESKENK